MCNESYAQCVTVKNSCWMKFVIYYIYCGAYKFIIYVGSDVDCNFSCKCASDVGKCSARCRDIIFSLRMNYWLQFCSLLCYEHMFLMIRSNSVISI